MKKHYAEAKKHFEKVEEDRNFQDRMREYQHEWNEWNNNQNDPRDIKTRTALSNKRLTEKTARYADICEAMPRHSPFRI